MYDDNAYPQLPGFVVRHNTWPAYHNRSNPARQTRSHGCSNEGANMTCDFLVETYATERTKVLSVWSEFHDSDLPFRPNASDTRGRSVREQMVHKCVSEDIWFRTMLGINVAAPPLPQQETRFEFVKRYAEDSGKRLAKLQTKDAAWWEGSAQFFDVVKSRAWIVTRRLTHTAHHRGQQM